MTTLWTNIFKHPRLGVIFALGFASGLPLALSGSTLQAWYAVSGVDIAQIGLLSLVGQPYVFKFLWAPLLDKFIPLAFIPALNERRKAWMLLSQIVMTVVLILMAFMQPQQAPLLLAFMGLFLATASATQDIAFDAYRTDVLPPRERGLGAAFSVTGYRIAMLVSGGLVLIMADYAGWQVSILLMAALMLLSAVVSYLAPQPENKPLHLPGLREAVIHPFTEFWQRKPYLRQHALFLLLFILLYKLGDAFAGSLTTTFLLRGLDFTLTDVGLANKSIGLFATLGGVFIGGIVLYRYGLFRSLLWFALLQAVTNLGFVVLAISGKSYLGMLIIIALENLAGGMGTAAFVAFLMGLCHSAYSATQFALFSALAAAGRVYVGPLSGWMIEQSGWAVFYLWTVLFALPGIFMIFFIRPAIDAMNEKN